jgi:hypothetical protein
MSSVIAIFVRQDGPAWHRAIVAFVGVGVIVLASYGFAAATGVSQVVAIVVLLLIVGLLWGIVHLRKSMP